MKNADGVICTRTLRRASSGALTLENIIEVPASTRAGAEQDAKPWHYHFAAKADEVAFSCDALNDVQPYFAQSRRPCLSRAGRNPEPDATLVASVFTREYSRRASQKVRVANGRFL
ncbi:MAG: hypothetical protein ACR2MB_17030 [Acidimicrobiales bacterium]